MSEPSYSANEAALLEAIETRLATMESLLRAQQGTLTCLPARLTEAVSHTCAKCGSQILMAEYYYRNGLYYHIAHVPF